MREERWRFVSNQNSTIAGLNDAGIETFTADMYRSLVREIIQNSLDAILDKNKPVEVDFNEFDVLRDEIPDCNGLDKAIKACKDINKNDEPDAYKYFDNAEKVVNDKLIHVLRVSDHNTTGLEGSDTCNKGTSWSRLVKESGSSNKGESSGGSFGIGKSAAFACSDLRTVFYSSLDCNGLESNIGVARLVSFNDDEIQGLTTGVGYYSKDKNFVAIPKQLFLEKNYKRENSGTDIYVIGMHKTAEFKNLIIKSVLTHFLVSIVKEKLVVNVQGELINKKTMAKLISRLNPNESEEIRNLVEYYDLITSKNPQIKVIKLDNEIYGKKYGFESGECTLYLREKEGLNRKILITRKSGMKIYEQDRISGSIEFTGVAIIDGNNMNKEFKKMEVPSHDAWEPGRCRGEEAKYKKILSEVKRYLRDTVKDCYGKVMTKEMDAIGASDFLPDQTDTETDNYEKSDFSTLIKQVTTVEKEPNKKTVESTDVDFMDSSETGITGGGTSNGGNGGGSSNHSGEGQAEGNGNGNSETPSDDKGYKLINVKKRLMCKDVKNGKYVLSMVVPSTASKSKMKFVVVGEQSDTVIPIVNASIKSSKAKTEIDRIVQNSLFLNNVVSGDMLKVEISIDFDKYCMMEVEYYANKR